MALQPHDPSCAEIRAKRISIELDHLNQLPEEFKFSTFETGLGLYIRLHIDKKALPEIEEEIEGGNDQEQEQHKEEESKEEAKVKTAPVDIGIDQFIFDILLDHRYPFQQPQIFCRTPFSNPPLNDGRDIFNDVLRSEWRIAKKLHDIVQFIPEFIVEVIVNDDAMRVFGKFHLGYTYEMSNWGANSINRDSLVFDCQEQEECDEETFYPRQLVLTQSALLLFEPHQQVKNMGLLLAWATLQSLDKIRRNLNRPDLVTFVWRQIEGKQPWVLNLLISKPDECISRLVKNMQSMGVGVEKNTSKQQVILEKEVTKEAISQMDIEQILEHIALYESAIVNDLSLSTVQTLTTLYQKAIEYYSALDDFMFKNFLNRMQSLLQREDIQIVLNSIEEEHKKDQTKKQGNSQKPAEKEEVEEEVKKEQPESKAQEIAMQKKAFQIGDDDSNDDQVEATKVVTKQDELQDQKDSNQHEAIAEKDPIQTESTESMKKDEEDLEK